MSMLNRAVAVAAVAAAIFVGGCEERIGEDTFAQIQVGMTRQAVEKILGEGTEETSGGYGISAGGIATGNTGSRDTVKTYTWKSGKKVIIVDFRNDEVVNVRKQGF